MSGSVKERLVVVGGSAAGMSAASQARRRRGPGELEIVAFERTGYPSYSACGIPYLVGGLVPDGESLIARTPETFRDQYQIDARVGHEVHGIDLGRRAVEVASRPGGRTEWEPFDQLVIAVGAEPIRPELPGSDATGICGLKSLEDGLYLNALIEREQPRRAVVVGGGYIGIEMAEALIMRGISVALVERNPQVMTTLDVELGALVSHALRQVGVDLYLSETVTGYETSNGRVSGVVTEARTLPADLVVLGIGTRPDSRLARAAGIPVGPTGGIRVNHQMQTEVRGVWSCGDCTETFHLVSRRPVAFALGTIANKQGRITGINLGGGYATFPGVVGTAVSKLCDLEVARTGLNERESRRAGFQFLTATIESTSRAGYYPNPGHLTVKVLAERETGRLLGAQIVGREGAAKRIDVFATALFAGFTVFDLVNLDLSYAPPFAPVWDPVLVAARKAVDLVEADRR
jgi:NADPH-dependent 2,4-dienoyl-CoA reductase/sulfur reductase-like enzyme